MYQNKVTGSLASSHKPGNSATTVKWSINVWGCAETPPCNIHNYECKKLITYTYTLCYVAATQSRLEYANVFTFNLDDTYYIVKMQIDKFASNLIFLVLIEYRNILQTSWSLPAYLTRVRKANLPFIHVTKFPIFDTTHINMASSSCKYRCQPWRSAILETADTRSEVNARNLCTGLTFYK